ncbi:hypothetical protein [Mycoplasma parvum]|uniref:Uncharacterized protein n=1 Tax=Mycoplasma parvum str. Indiana TaxID=1403316 RepID=U5NG24_9MOLU|nr:hypothetical protein [Mycoplasma parvum]AGX89139.1 hypothetical protein PRV_02005 [Mycoplasma parvum str. Indiana]
MKKGLIASIIGCPYGLWVGVNLIKKLEVGFTSSVKSDRIMDWETFKSNSEKKINLGGETNITILKHGGNDHKKEIKVAIPCLNGDMIGYNGWEQTSKVGLGWTDFIKRIENGLKGYLNLMFSCNFKKVVEDFIKGGWDGQRRFGTKEQNIAAIVIAARSPMNKMTGLKNTQQEELSREKNSHKNRGYLKLFDGRYSRGDEKTEILINGVVLKTWIHNRNEFQETYQKEVQANVRRALAETITGIVINGNWCTQKDWSHGNCLKWEKYKTKLNEYGFIQSQNIKEIKEFQLDGKTGVQWHTGQEGKGRPVWIWQGMKDYEKGGDNFWKKVIEYLGNLSDSSWFKKIQNEVADEISYRVFCDLIGGNRTKEIELVRLAISNEELRKKMCSIGKNGIICPKGGLIWKDKN